MKIAQILIIALISAAVALGVSWLSPRNGGGESAQAKESAYDRVMRTGVLKCGYILYPRFLERDLNTKEMSGMYFDMMEEIARHLSLKLEWTEEVGFANAFDGLNTGRYDVMCMPFNQTAGRARVNEFTVPVVFYPYYMYVRNGDTRFDNNYERANDPKVKVVYLEGEFSQTIKAERFPKAAHVSLPNLSDISQVLMELAAGKADLTMTEPTSAERFLVNNPGKLKRVVGPSLYMQAGGLSVGIGEEKLKSMLNTTIRAMQASGSLQRIMDKYTTMPDQFFYPAQPWGESSRPVIR